MNNTCTGRYLTVTVRQMVFILLISAALGMTVNLIRPDSIPFVGSWSIDRKSVV